MKSIQYLIYRLKYRYGNILPLSVPVDVSLELSSFCTNTCGYCYHADQKKLPFQRGKMSRELAFKVIREAADMGVNSLKFNFRGESTMNPHFEEITAYAKSLARGATFIDRITNSNFNFKNDREDIFRGLCNQTKVKVSFDSFIKEVFEKQRRGSNYERTIENIDKFYQYPGRENILVIQSVRTLLNKDEDLKHEIKKRWPNALASVRDCVEGRTQRDTSEFVEKYLDQDNRQSCLQAHVRLMVHWDGKVSACCPDITGKLILGDANTEHLKDIFNSPKAEKLRTSLNNKTAFAYSPCKSCPSFESYSGFKPAWDS